MATTGDINAFLIRFKAFVAAGELRFIPRTFSDLASLGITFEQAEDVLLGLGPRDYCKGPEDDEDGSPGEVWVFGNEIDRTSVYIKLKLHGDQGDDARCLSFHAANSPLRFPHR